MLDIVFNKLTTFVSYDYDVQRCISMVTNQNRLSPYLGFLLYFYKSQSYTLCKYTYNFKMFKTYHSEAI